MNESWDKPTGWELIENKEANRRMRVIAWMFVAAVGLGTCLVFGMLLGFFIGKAG